MVYTFHFHDSIVRNIPRIIFLLSFNPGLIVLLTGDYDYRPACHALERAYLALLSVRVHICLEVVVVVVSEEGKDVGRKKKKKKKILSLL